MEELKREAILIIEELKGRHPYILGFSISGSIAMGLADEFSDIDIDIWLKEENFKYWEIEETCPLMRHFSEYNIYREMPSNFSFIKGEYKFDISTHSIERVKNDTWNIKQKANRKNSIIIYDTEDIIKRLIEEKAINNSIGLKSKGEYSSESPWEPSCYNFYISAYLNYFCPLAVARRDWGQAHLNLTQTIYFILERAWIEKIGNYPYEKSLWAITRKAMTEYQQELLKQASLIKDHSVEDINRRRKLLRELCSEINIPITKFYHHKTSLD